MQTTVARYRGWDTAAYYDRKPDYVTGGAYGVGAPRTPHDPPLLYDLHADPGERFDVAAAHPDAVARTGAPGRGASPHRRAGRAAVQTTPASAATLTTVGAPPRLRHEFYTAVMSDPALEAVRAFFAGGVPGVAAVYVFGSVARGTARADSDVDVGVLLVTPPAPTLEGQAFDLEDALDRAVGRPVDVVILNTAPADLRMRVLRDGVLAFEGDPVGRVRFEVATRNEYFDLEPILQEYRRPRSSA
jgi:uncharacterized protein